MLRAQPPMKAMKEGGAGGRRGYVRSMGYGCMMGYPAARTSRALPAPLVCKTLGLEARPKPQRGKQAALCLGTVIQRHAQAQQGLRGRAGFVQRSVVSQVASAVDAAVHGDGRAVHPLEGDAPDGHARGLQPARLHHPA